MYFICLCTWLNVYLCVNCEKIYKSSVFSSNKPLYEELRCAKCNKMSTTLKNRLCNGCMKNDNENKLEQCKTCKSYRLFSSFIKG